MKTLQMLSKMLRNCTNASNNVTKPYNCLLLNETIQIFTANPTNFKTIILNNENYTNVIKFFKSSAQIFFATQLRHFETSFYKKKS